MSELNFKMGTKTSTVPSSGTSGEVFFTTDENKYGHIYFIDRKNKIINVIPNLLDIAHGGTGATTAATALTNLGLTATATELNYVKGATSSLQTQLNNKSEKNHTHDYLSLTGGVMTGSINLSGVNNGLTFGNGGYTTDKSGNFKAGSTAATWNLFDKDGNSKFSVAWATGDARVRGWLTVDGTISGNLSGNASTATKATQDGSGNVITSTYATKTELNTTKSNLQSSIDGKLSLSGGTMTGSIILPTNDNMGIIPSTNNYGQIGSSDKQFYRMYAKNFYGTLQGNATSATSATKATQDASGNVITSTYATKTELDSAKSSLQSSINGKANSSHTHDDRYYTESEVDSKLSGKANSSHGNHVPATQTANNAKFLRNDNTWQTVTPANIGAATSGHTHTDALYTVATGSSEKFVKACTLKTNWGLNDTVSVKFDFVDMDKKFTEVVAYISCSLDNSKYTYGISANGDYSKAYAYVYANGILEVWIRVRTYSSTRIYPRSNYSRDGIVTWDFEEATALPTDALESKQAVASEWSGNAASATTATKATTATTATNIKDYNGDYKIQIGYNGGGISGDQIAYIAGYTNSNGIKIKDVSKSALQSWLGLGSAAYTASTAYATSGHTHNYAGSSSAGGSATSAVKLDTTTAGSATQPTYFSGGKPVACTYTLGKSVPSNAVFTDTTYSTATQSAQGLMSAADKKKLDGIASGANAYSLPTASSSTLGGVKTTSTVTSTSGLTACPIISGVPYYKDTNTTYSLSSFGITATAAELNYTDGVTSNIQTQLNGKVDLSSAQTVSGVKTFSNGIKIGNTTMSYDSTNKRLVISVT